MVRLRSSLSLIPLNMWRRNNHFAAVASDQPALEVSIACVLATKLNSPKRWPTPDGIPHMHQVSDVGYEYPYLSATDTTARRYWGE